MTSLPDHPPATSVWRSLGPTLITAAVVIGPGTITIASKLGSTHGYGALWVVLVSACFMWVFATMATRVGILNSESLLTVVTRLYGRPVAIAMGLLAFIVTSAFQLSNYLACATALTSLTAIPETTWVGMVGAAGLMFLIIRQLYRFIEKAMLLLVLAMIGAFVINLIAVQPDWGAVAHGVIPKPWPAASTALIIGMVATTFSVIAALYQSALAQQKQWKPSQLRMSRQEAAIGIGLLAIITSVVMITAGTALRGVDVSSAAVLAVQFEPAMGPAGVWLFSLGFLAAGISSVVINPMVGGGLLSDGLGLGSGVNQKWPRVLTGAGMVIGIVSAFLALKKASALEGIVLAQSATILAVPLCAIVLTALANDRRAVGTHRNNLPTNLVAGLAIVVLVGISVRRLFL